MTTKAFSKHKDCQVPDDIRVESLTDEQARDLNRFKDWLYHQRIKARLERDKAERRQNKEDAEMQKGIGQPALFTF